MTDIDQPFSGRFPVAGIALPGIDADPLDMMGVAGELTVHHIGAVAYGLGMAFCAIPRLAEGRMPRHRFVQVAAVARLFSGMAVGKAMFMTDGTARAAIVAIAPVSPVMLALRCMADVADAVVGS